MHAGTYPAQAFGIKFSYKKHFQTLCDNQFDVA